VNAATNGILSGALAMTEPLETDERVEELVVDWEEQWIATGVEPSIEDLCAASPELMNEVRQAIESLRGTGWMMDSSIEASNDALSLPRRRVPDADSRDTDSQDTELPASLPTLADFVAALSDSGLMADDELDQERRHLGSADARALAESLIRQERLTAFQVRVLCGLKNDTPLVLGDYVLLDELGEGGMGKVYRARHRRLDTDVALKVMSASVLDNTDAVQRFEREARVAASLNHPHIVRVQDAREESGRQLLVMELVEGENLSELVKRRGPLPVGESIECLRQAALGLQHAHEQGVIHRDIKPSNILVDVSGRVRILDMGLARPQVQGGRVGDVTRPELTTTGHVMGTIDFMAPEQGEDARSADERSDIYSLGCTLYYLLTGSSVYPGATPMQRLLAHHKAPIPSLRQLRPDVPESLDAAFQKMLAKSPDERLASMTELLELLASIDTESSAPPSPVTPPAETHEPEGTSVDESLEGTVTFQRGAGKPQTAEAAESFPPASTGAANRNRWLTVAALLLIAGFAGLYAAGVIFNVRTSGGTLTLECDPALLADAEITIDGGKVTLNDPGDGKPVTITVDKNSGELEITRPGFKLFAREFRLADDDDHSICITFERAVDKQPTTVPNVDRPTDELAR